MKLHPFYQVVAEAGKLADQGFEVHEQFNCAKCGTKQTMDEANTFFTKGICEECGHVTDIEKDGCNFLLIKTTPKVP